MEPHERNIGDTHRSNRDGSLLVRFLLVPPGDRTPGRPLSAEDAEMSGEAAAGSAGAALVERPTAAAAPRARLSLEQHQDRMRVPVLAPLLMDSETRRHELRQTQTAPLL